MGVFFGADVTAAVVVERPQRTADQVGPPAKAIQQRLRVQVAVQVFRELRGSVFGVEQDLIRVLLMHLVRRLANALAVAVDQAHVRQPEGIAVVAGGSVTDHNGQPTRIQPPDLPNRGLHVSQRTGVVTDLVANAPANHAGMVIIPGNQAFQPIFRQRVVLVGQLIKTPEGHFGEDHHAALIQVIQRFRGQGQVR